MGRVVDLLSVIGLVLWIAIAALVLVRIRSASGAALGRLHWLATGLVATAALSIAGVTSSLLLDWPDRPGVGAATGCVLLPLAALLGRSPRLRPYGAPVLTRTIVTCGLVALVGAIYLLVVLGLGRRPRGDERMLLGLSILAAAVACVLAFPARRRLEDWANRRVYGDRAAPDEALRTFGGRMSRAVPMDELLLQLVEILHKTLRLSAAEIWSADEGGLARTVSVPARVPARVELRGEERTVLARAHAQGNAWLQVWAAELLAGRGDAQVRLVSIAHLGELMGVFVLERPAGEDPFTEEEDRVLVDLARQLGVALHNVRLDSALQASLDELKLRNEELIASRARIVAAGVESRRRIERDLHDGAQQHLVAMAVKIGLVRTLLDADPARAGALLDELRADAQATLTELRELAHGIYPPLLRDRGLREALENAADRAGLPTTVVADGVGRYDSDTEAAVYFCCLEAIQNAGKHAGQSACVHVAVGDGDGTLWFEVADDGVGFDPVTAGRGDGFVNMRDRLGALGGHLTVSSEPGRGAVIRGWLPATARQH